MQYIERVRGYAEQMPIDEAVERAITECIGEGILAEFLKRNRAEARKVSIYEYNEEQHLETVRSEGYEDGLVQGVVKSILDLLEDLGEVSVEVREKIVTQTDMEMLSQWLKHAAKSASLEAFIQKANI